MKSAGVWLTLCVLLPQIPAFAETPKKSDIVLRRVPHKDSVRSIDSTDDRIQCDFPEPTDIRDIAKAFSLWTGHSYVVDTGVSKKVRLMSPERVSVDEGLKRFHSMLAANQLTTDEEGTATVIRAAK